MGLKGNLATIILPDVLQWLSTSQKTGILHVRGAQGVTKKVFFKAGVVVSSASSDPREYLGQFLISRGYLTEEQLNKAMETQLKTGIMLGRILLMIGVLEEHELQAMLQLKAEENLYDLFLWEEGEFAFEDLPAIEDGMVQANLDVTSTVMEGIRRKDEWMRIRRVFPTDRVVLGHTDKKLLMDGLKPNSMLVKVYNAIDGQRSLADLALEFHSTEFHVSETAYKLFEKGLCEVAFEKPTPHEESFNLVQRGLLKEAARALDDKRYEEAANLYRYLKRTFPDDEEVLKGLTIAEEGMSQSFFKEVVPLRSILELAVPLRELMTRQDITPQEGYIASRVNGNWDINAILKTCPMPEREALKAIRKLIDRKVLAVKVPPESAT